MDEKERKGFLLFKDALKGTLYSLVLTALSLLVVSVIYLQGDFSDETARAIVSGCAFLSVFLPALRTGMKRKNRGLLLGLLSGLFFSLCLYLTGFMAFGVIGISKSLFAMMALCMFIGALGGIAGVNIKGRK